MAHGSATDNTADFIRRHPTIVIGAVLLALITLMALFAPFIARDPIVFEPINRLKSPSAEFWLGTDSLGRDVYARTVYGARISLLVGLTVAIVSVTCGLLIGLLAGYFQRVDAVVMRVMDGVMAIPAILLAIALVALLGASVKVVIIAIAIPEIPRVTRLVRAVVLSVRDLPFVEAALQWHPDRQTVAPTHPAQHRRAADRPGDLHLCLGHPHRSWPEFPGRWHTAGDSDLGKHDCVKPSVSADRSLDHFCAWLVPCTGGAGGQPAWRRAARPARPAYFEADVSDTRPTEVAQRRSLKGGGLT